MYAHDMGVVFGRLLREKREAVGLSGYRLVKLAALHPANLTAIEKGRRPPSQATLEALASVQELGLSLGDLRAMAALDRLGDDWPLARAWVEEHGWDALGAQASGDEGSGA